MAAILLVSIGGSIYVHNTLFRFLFVINTESHVFVLVYPIKSKQNTRKFVLFKENVKEVVWYEYVLIATVFLRNDLNGKRERLHLIDDNRVAWVAQTAPAPRRPHAFVLAQRDTQNVSDKFISGCNKHSETKRGHPSLHTAVMLIYFPRDAAALCAFIQHISATKQNNPTFNSPSVNFNERLSYSKTIWSSELIAQLSCGLNSKQSVWRTVTGSCSGETPDAIKYAKQFLQITASSLSWRLPEENLTICSKWLENISTCRQPSCHLHILILKKNTKTPPTVYYTQAAFHQIQA